MFCREFSLTFLYVLCFCTSIGSVNQFFWSLNAFKQPLLPRSMAQNCAGAGEAAKVILQPSVTIMLFCDIFITCLAVDTKSYVDATLITLVLFSEAFTSA